MPAFKVTLYFLPLLVVGVICRLGASDRPIVDFADEGAPVSFRFQDSGQSGRIKELGGRLAFEITWDGVQKPYCELSLRQKPTLPAFIEGLLAVDIFIPENSRATLLTVRLQDRDDEIFQFRQNIPPKAAGWHRLEFPVDMAKAPSVSWGGKTPNKELDAPLRLAGLSVGYSDRQSVGTLGLGTVTVEVTKGMIESRLGTGNPLHVVKPGEEGLLAILLKNPANRETTVKLQYSITFAGGNGAPTHFEKTVSLAPNGETSVGLPPPLKYGVYKLGLQLSDERGEFGEKELSYGYMPPAGPVPGRAKGFLFGISEHPQWYSRPEQDLMAEAAAWAGIKVIRDGIDWRRMQPKPGEWRFESFDYFLDAFAKYDIELAPTYPGPLPAWATAADWTPAKPVNRGRPRPDYGHWVEFVRTFAERYKGRIRFVETWNEPDLLSFANFSVEEYVRLMEIAYTETKKVDPDIVVQSGGFTGFKVPAASSSDADFLEKSVRDGKEFYDVFAFHGHGTFRHYEPQIRKLAELRASLGDDTPWWANETAVSAIHVGEVGQAENLFQKLLFSWAHGAIGYNWYNLRNKGFDPKNNEHNFGLLTRDFYPKPAYVTYNMLARYYREGEFVRAIDMGVGQHGYLFREKAGGYLLANWNGDSFAGDTRPVFVTGVTGAASIIDLWGNETPVPVVNGTLILPVSRRPSTLRLLGQIGEPGVSGNLIRPQGEFTAEAGGRREFSLAIGNPSAGDLDFVFAFEAPSGMRIEPARTTVRLRAGETRDIAFGVVADAATDMGGGAGKSITLNLGVGDLWDGVFAYGVRTVVRVPRGDFTDTPLFVLGDVGQVTSLVVNEPSTAHLFWKGAADLGAEVRLAERGGQLLLKVVVTDDVHVQPHTGADVWMGDNVQFAFNIPGQDTAWEIGLTHLASGESEVHVWQAPRGRKADELACVIILKTNRDEAAKRTVYEARIPLAAIGLDHAAARRGFGFNLLVNDNDGTARESFIAIAPGLGRGKETAGWPLLGIDD